MPPTELGADQGRQADGVPAYFWAAVLAAAMAALAWSIM